MSGKGSISRMSDECLMKGKSGMPYFYEYQAGTRKFTLAGKSLPFHSPLLMTLVLDGTALTSQLSPIGSSVGSRPLYVLS